MSANLINLSSLEAYLWESANILRGPVDAADFKTYIFPMLFFKRISDVYDAKIVAVLVVEQVELCDLTHSFDVSGAMMMHEVSLQRAPEALDGALT